MTRFRLGWLPLLLAVTLIGAVGCGDDNDDDEGASSSPSTEASDETTTSAAQSESDLSGEIIVLAAASLTEAFTEAGKAFEAEHPDTKVTFSFASSSSLALQANQGAPADLFASANEKNMKKVTDTGNATGPTTFVNNKLAIMVVEGNPKDITSLEDLARSDVKFVLCAPEVPCGTFGQQALDKAGVSAKPVSFEDDVKAVVTKVSLDEVDAGITYVTDVKAAEAAGEPVEGVDVAAENNVLANYPIAMLEQSENTEVAMAFKDFILSPEGQQIMVTFGFIPAA
ncbi:MAG: molybdate ABC transporter substrate-binding protein [Acidimicrobiia bacterium]